MHDKRRVWEARQGNMSQIENICDAFNKRGLSIAANWTSLTSEGVVVDFALSAAGYSKGTQRDATFSYDPLPKHTQNIHNLKKKMW